MRHLKDVECWFAPFEANNLVYYMPVNLLQVLALRAHGIQAIRANFDEIRKRENLENTRKSL